MIDWRAIPFAKNSSCVGYCPENCSWETFEEEEDCKAIQEDKLKNTTETPGGCFQARISKTLQDHDFYDEAAKFNKEMVELIRKSRTEGEDAFPESWKHLKCLKSFVKTNDDARKSVKKRFGGKWEGDRFDIIEFTMVKLVKWAKVPNLDGLYGGEPCIKDTDKSKLFIAKVCYKIKF